MQIEQQKSDTWIAGNIITLVIICILTLILAGQTKPTAINILIFFLDLLIVIIVVGLNCLPRKITIPDAKDILRPDCIYLVSSRLEWDEEPHGHICRVLNFWPKTGEYVTCWFKDEPPKRFIVKARGWSGSGEKNDIGFSFEGVSNQEMNEIQNHSDSLNRFIKYDPGQQTQPAS